MLYKKIYEMLLPQQKTTTLVKILFRAAHTYSKDSKKRCLVNWSKNRAALDYPLCIASKYIAPFNIPYLIHTTESTTHAYIQTQLNAKKTPN